MPKLQILVATMHQTDFSKVKEMKIVSDVIFANQSDSNRVDEKEYADFKARMVTTTTRGVGMNRNIALEHADGDILLIADDDMEYVTGYKETVLNAFISLPDADALIFNINTIGQDMKRRQNEKIQRVCFWNSLNYGAVRIAVKRKSLEEKKITFNLNFGGGTTYSAGEDSLFISDMIRKGLKLYTYPETIASVNQDDSTWFRGYNQKYFYDKGAFFAAFTPKLAFLMCLQDILRHRSMYNDIPFRDMIVQSVKGIKGYKKLLPYKV